MFREITLRGDCIADLDTEVRFSIATARADGGSLIKFILPLANEGDRAYACLIKVLRPLVRSGKIQFFVTDDDIKKRTTASEFLINKYGDAILNADESAYVFVKI